jgi:YggT family protein
MILAVTRTDLAYYLTALVWIYTLLILLRILLTWAVMLPQVVGALQHPVLRNLVGFVEDVTEPYLALWRKIIPPLRTGPGLIDLSPIIAIFALQLVGGILARVITG